MIITVIPYHIINQYCWISGSPITNNSTKLSTTDKLSIITIKTTQLKYILKNGSQTRCDAEERNTIQLIPEVFLSTPLVSTTFREITMNYEKCS